MQNELKLAIQDLISKMQDVKIGDVAPEGFGVAYKAAIDLQKFADKSPWISVKDRLPEKYQEVLAYPWPTDYCITAERDDNGFYYGEYMNNYGHENVRLNEGRITHWMPLPDAPTTNTENV